MKIIITALIILLTFQASGTNGQRGDLLCSIENKRVAIFINSIYDDAQYVSDKYNVPISLIIAQSCQETGYGKSKLCREYCNFFGVRRNHENCQYSTQRESFEDYGRVMTNRCYSSEELITLKDWYRKLIECKYAGDKNYTRRLNNLIFRLGLDKLI